MIKLLFSLEVVVTPLYTVEIDLSKRLLLASCTSGLGYWLKEC